MKIRITQKNNKEESDGEYLRCDRVAYGLVSFVVLVLQDNLAVAPLVERCLGMIYVLSTQFGSISRIS